MDIDQLKKENDGYKTVKIDNIFFLINDGGDELGYHYNQNIISNPNVMKNMLIQRCIKYCNKYFFCIIPDKSVLLKNILESVFKKKCYRPTLEVIKDLDCVIDSYDSIIDICSKNNSMCCHSTDTHSTQLSLYAFYSSVVTKLNLVPIDIIISQVPYSRGDLTCEINNGTRDYENINKWNLPIFALKNNYELDCFQIIDIFKENHLDSNNRLYNHEINRNNVNCLINQSIDNNIKVLYFHDSNMNHLIKTCFSSHYKYNYFINGQFDENIISLINPDIIIEETMERFLNTYRG